MDTYIVNENNQSNGDHEVHNKTKPCQFMPNNENQKDLGKHPNDQAAVKEAKKHYKNADGCKYCCPSAHRS